MTKKQQQVAGADRQPSEKEGSGREGRENCRCKEISQKTVPEMLKLMISDVAFWKKPRARK